MSYVQKYFSTVLNLLIVIALWFFGVSLITHPLANYLLVIVLVAATGGPISLYINRKENVK